jgi:hypothetical protein
VTATGALAFTGENALGELEGALAAVFIGGILLIVTRRRRK